MIPKQAPSESLHRRVDQGERLNKDEVVVTSLAHQAWLTNMRGPIVEGGVKEEEYWLVSKAHI